jgi:hypothetical protein
MICACPGAVYFRKRDWPGTSDRNCNSLTPARLPHPPPQRIPIPCPFSFLWSPSTHRVGVNSKRISHGPPHQKTSLRRQTTGKRCQTSPRSLNWHTIPSFPLLLYCSLPVLCSLRFDPLSASPSPFGAEMRAKVWGERMRGYAPVASLAFSPPPQALRVN